MKKIKVEFETDYGMSHCGSVTESDETEFKVSDRLAEYLRPLIEEEGPLSMLAVDELLETLEDTDQKMYRDLDNLKDDIMNVIDKSIMRFCVENDSDGYSDDTICEWRYKDLEEGRFVPEFSNAKEYFEAHRAKYDEDADEFDAEDDYEDWLCDAYQDWVMSLDDVYDQVERLFDEYFNPRERVYDYGFSIVWVEE